MRIFQARCLVVWGVLAALNGCATSEQPLPRSVDELPKQIPEVPSHEAQPGREEAMPASVPGHSVFFLRGESFIDAAAEEVLRTHAERLKAEPGLVVTLIGRTDPLGSRSFNLAVAEQRTAEVAKVLRSMGVAKAQIRRYSLGGEKQKRDCRTEECRKFLRRVDLVYPVAKPGRISEAGRAHK